jgi:flagellar M-ring protein FliF
VLQIIKEKLNASTAGFKLDPRIGLFALAGAAAFLAVGISLYLWRDSDSMRPLYGEAEAYPAADVMQVLDSENLNYRLHPQSGQILVSENELARARILLSAKGVKISVPAGYDLFDREEPLGTSQFVQNVRLRRSLEGELARTIMAVKGVQQARVHLALQENTSFVVSNREPAKASVMVQLDPGHKLNQDQVIAIINLVASSVAKLKIDDVSVVDQYGTLLSRGLTEGSNASQNWQVVGDYQQKTAGNIEEVLAPILGQGNYRISVTADMDFSQKEETYQAFGDTAKVRNEVIEDESVMDQLAIGIPGSLSNRPPAQPASGVAAGAPKPDASAKTANSVRKGTTRKLDYDQTITHIKHPAFNLRHQSIAVVLNGEPDDDRWSAATRTALDEMLRSAVGFNSARGDTLTLSVFPFATVDSRVAEQSWWRDSDVHGLIRLGVLALISLLLLLLVVRPAMSQLTRRSIAMDKDEPGSVEAGDASVPQLPGATKALAVTGKGLSEFNPLSEITLPGAGSGLELQLEHLQMLAKNDSERVSEVIKQWIGRNETKNNSSN